MKTKNLTILILVLLVPLVFSQRGGGGGGRSGGGGGSRGGSRGSYARRSASCQDKCLANPDPMCIQNCMNSSLSLGATLAIIFGSIGCGFGIGALRCCGCNCSCCKYLPCHKYQKLKKQLNVPDQNCLSEQQYIMKRDNIVQLLNRSKTGNNFGYIQMDQKQKIQAHAQIVKQSKYVTQLKLTGQDRYGQWSANAFILPKNGTMFFWMYKQYNDKQEAGQTGEWSHLIYQSTLYDLQTGMEGKWYYLDYQHDKQYSGFWKLSTQALPHIQAF